MDIILIVTVPCKELEIKKREKAKMKIEEGDDEQRWVKSSTRKNKHVQRKGEKGRKKRKNLVK